MTTTLSLSNRRGDVKRMSFYFRIVEMDMGLSPVMVRLSYLCYVLAGVDSNDVCSSTLIVVWASLIPTQHHVYSHALSVLVFAFGLRPSYRTATSLVKRRRGEHWMCY